MARTCGLLVAIWLMGTSCFGAVEDGMVICVSKDSFVLRVAVVVTTSRDSVKTKKEVEKDVTFLVQEELLRGTPRGPAEYWYTRFADLKKGMKVHVQYYKEGKKLMCTGIRQPKTKKTN